MKVRRKIYEGLIAQCEALAAALHEEKSKRQLWTRKYYTLLLGIESARREAGAGGMDAAPTRFGSEVNGCRPVFGSIRPAETDWGSRSDAHSAVVTLDDRVSPFDPDGFYTATALNTLEAFGALPYRTVANAYCDAPPTVALTTELTRPVLSGGDECSTSPLPPVEPVCDAFLRNAREPLSPDTTIINSAV